MVYRENSIEMDDLGVPPFWETPILVVLGIRIPVCINIKSEIKPYFWVTPNEIKQNMCFPSDQLQFARRLILNLPLTCLRTGLAANV